MIALPRLIFILALLGALASPLGAQAKKAPPPPEPELDLNALYERGRQLYDELAPAELKRQFEFPTRQQWELFAQRFQQALDSNDLNALAAYASEAKMALAALRMFPELADYADWIAERLDYAEGAAQAVKRPPPKPPARPSATRPFIPHYDVWLARMKARPVPPRAPALLSRVTAAFTAEGMPAALVWLAEAESTFNPTARSPVGAKGLFQLMPDTAKELGLRTFLPDERADPEKNARAAARYLKQLHGRFGDWPLTLAAYNAGPGRIRRTLDTRKGRTFADIASSLPNETRMYVPKVFATLTVRAGVEPGALPPPRR
jgi:membrane-bound lytic murein transglycosylase D